MTHICVSKLTIIGSDNGLSPGQHQAIIWTNDGILLTGTLGTNFNEILIEIYTLSFKKMHLKMSSGKWRPFCLSLNVVRKWPAVYISHFLNLYKLEDQIEWYSLGNCSNLCCIMLGNYCAVWSVTIIMKWLICYRLLILKRMQFLQ